MTAMQVLRTFATATAGLGVAVVIPGLAAKATGKDVLSRGWVGVLVAGAATFGASALALLASKRLAGEILAGGLAGCGLKAAINLAPDASYKALIPPPKSAPAPQQLVAPVPMKPSGSGYFLTPGDLQRAGVAGFGEYITAQNMAAAGVAEFGPEANF